MKQLSQRLERHLATGGMAEVFVAHDGTIVKRLLRQHMDSPEIVAMFAQEAEIGLSMSHPNIVQVLDAGLCGDLPAIVMARIDGRTLVDAGVLPPPLVAAIASDILAALAYAHGRQLIHRDITPANVFITKDGTAKLGDFGNAKGHAGYKTQTGVLKGSLAYMAPEQARAERADAKSDLFAVGLLMYELLSGRRAYDSDDDFELIELAREAQIPPLPPGPLSPLVMSALSPDPTSRPASAEAFRNALPSSSLAAVRRHFFPRRFFPRLRAPAWQLAAAVASGFVIVGLPAWFLRPAPTVVVVAPPPEPPPITIVLPQEPGFLMINASPWAEVRIDGKPAGTTPIMKMTVSAGTHRVTLFQPHSKKTHEVEVTVEPGKTQRLLHSF